MKRASLLVLFVSVFLPVTVVAQVQTGTPPLGTYGSGPDVINLANLNSHIAIPVLHRPGRGTDFTYNLGFDSSVWYPVGSSGNQSWHPVWNWGWAGQTQITTGYVTYSRQIGDCGTGRGRQPYDIYTYTFYDDQFGTPHPINLTVDDSIQNCSTGIGPFSATATLNDGSGYQVTVDATPAATVYSAHGTEFSPPLLQGVGVGSFTDRNGNQINVNASGVFTDTLGTTALTVSGGAPNPVTLSYTAPNNTAASYKVIYTAETVQTSFGCGIAEFGPTSENLVSEIDLPDIGIVPNDKYTITYEATPGHPGNVTGRIASITLPTGGMISYAYSGGSSGHITCADGTAATVTRTTPDGTWTYAHTESGTAWTTTVTDPAGNQTIYDFQGIYQTERKVYQGTSTLLEDDVTCYNGNITNCNGTAIALPITERIVTDTLGSQMCKHVFLYNTYGLLSERDDYDYPSGAPSALLRKQFISYAPLGNNIVDAPSHVTVENGSSGIVAQTTYQYDQTGVTATSGTPQHISISGSRGNATTISYLVGSTSLSKTFTYFDTGNVDVATDVNGAQTTYNYANATSTCGNAFPSSISEPLSLPAPSMTWNCTGGVELSVTDENSNTASTTYTDSHFWRPASSKDQEQNTTNYAYSDTNPHSVESSLVFNSNGSTNDALATLDGLGRTLVTQRKQSPNSSAYDSVETNYDSLGRPYQTTVPYSGTAGQTNGSAPKTTTTYDALSRPTQTQDGGGGTVSLTYTANDILQVIGPAPTGENPKQRQSEYNVLGELTSVCEITGLSGSGACTQNTSATGYWTKYSYDALGDLSGVTQNAQTTGQQQTRGYTYDDLGRLTSETNPETGTVHYVYDSDATCGTSNGDLVKKTDAAGNVICYAYDALHRTTSITYPSGPNSANTPGKHFVYDSATVNSVAMANAKTRLAEAYTCVSPCSTKITDEGFSYTVRGEVSDEYESTPHSGGYYHAAATYWANGVLNTLTGPGQYSNNYGVDGEGRVYSAGNGVNLASTTYNAASQPTIVIFGSLDSDSFTYDPNTGRMTQYKYNVNGQSVVGNLGWNADGALGSLNITDPFNAVNTQNCSYSHDDLARIATGNCGPIWSQTFTYDAFGNITKTGSSQFQPTYSYATNQMSSIGSFTPTYDSNGDVLNDALHSYAWDADTRPTTIDTVAVTYDALDRVVEQTKSGTSTEIEYSPTGFQMNLLNGQTATKAFVPMPGGTAEVWQAGGHYYRHSDWLGSSRFASTSTRTMYNDLAYAPFGEQYAQSGSTGVTDTSFAGNDEDTTTNLYDAQFREYGIQGRWPSPDPAGVAAVNPANPQSWNRYAYVMNSPLSAIDPSGLDCIYYDGFDANGDALVTVVPGDCRSDTDGGYFVDGTVFPNSLSTDSNGDLGLIFANSDNGTGGSDTIAGFLSGDPSTNYDPFAALQAQMQQNYFNNLQTLQNNAAPPTSAQISQAVVNGVQSTTPLTNPKFIPCFYVASAAVGYGGLYTVNTIQDFGFWPGFGVLKHQVQKYGGYIYAAGKTFVNVCNVQGD